MAKKQNKPTKYSSTKKNDLPKHANLNNQPAHSHRFTALFDYQIDLIPRLFKLELKHLAFIFVLIFSLFALSTSHDVLLEDDSLFVLTSYFYGIAHPPGYPLHTLLGKLFTFLPVGSIAFRVHLLSGFFGALTCVGVYWVTIKYAKNRIFGYLSAFLLATSAIFWSQSIIAEVYTLNTFFFILLIALLLHLNETKKPRVLFANAFVFGLSLTNHWPLMILGSPALLLLILPVRKLVFKHFLAVLGCFVLGIVPFYILLIIRSHMNPFISFYGPIESFKDFTYIFFRKGYGHIDKDTLSGSYDKLKFLRFYYQEIAAMYTYLGVPLAFYSIIKLFQTNKKIWLLWLLWTICGVSGLLVSLLSFNFEYDFKQIFRVYPLISYMGVAILITFGLQSLTAQLHNRYKNKFINQLPIGIGVTICLYLLITNWSINDRSHYDWSKNYAETILESLQPNATFFIKGDFEMPLAVYRYIENFRPDVTILQPNGLVFSSRLWEGYPYKNAKKERLQKLTKFIDATSDPIYYVTDVKHNYAKKFYGLYSLIDKQDPNNNVSIVSSDFLINYFDYVANINGNLDVFTEIHRNLIYMNCAKVIAKLYYFADNPKIITTYKPYITKLAQNFEGRLPVLKQALTAHDQQRPVDLDYIWSLSSINYENWDRPLKKRELAKFYYYRGLLGIKLNKPIAMQEFRKSADINFLYANPAVKVIIDYYYQQKDWKNYFELREKILFTKQNLSPNIKKMDKEMLQYKRVLFNY